jgi:hypothetical protein
LSQGNPGRGHTVNVGFANGERKWGERFDLLDTLLQVLGEQQLEASRGERWLKLQSGLVLQPQIVAIHPLDDGGIRTVTTIDVSHPALIPAGTFEYQHSTGADTAASALAGFKGWAAMDLPVFLDALLEQPQRCMVLSFGSQDAAAPHPLQGRRVVLGPVSQFAQEPAVETAEGHDFCSCCMFTRNFDTFKPLLDGGAPQSIRFYALRGEDGRAQADCRVNGLDFEAGTKALVGYVASWPQRGFEFRKQFGLIHSLPG